MEYKFIIPTLNGDTTQTIKIESIDDSIPDVNGTNSASLTCEFTDLPTTELDIIRALAQWHALAPK